MFSTGREEKKDVVDKRMAGEINETDESYNFSFLGTDCRLCNLWKINLYIKGVFTYAINHGSSFGEQAIQSFAESHWQ